MGMEIKRKKWDKTTWECSITELKVKVKFVAGGTVCIVNDRGRTWRAGNKDKSTM